jgi:polysaccharide export outer membrane protein
MELQTAEPAAQQVTAEKPESTPKFSIRGDAPAELESPKSPASTAAAGVVDASSFVIGPEDQLSVRVWGDERLSGPLLVRPDGRISMNLIGEVMAAGKTPEQLSRAIETLLKEKDILRRPQVNVQVTSVQSKKYSINGEVNKPGSFPLTVPTRVLEALVNAGGFRDFANKKNIQIIRGDQRLKFNWNEVVKGKRTEQNIFLEPGDIIIVR